MAGREELYLKRIAENTERIAKALEKLAEARTVKDVKFDSDGLKLIYGNVPVSNAMQLQSWLNGYTATQKDDAHVEYFVCERCLNMFNRETAEKVGMVCPDCNLTLVPLITVEKGEKDDQNRT